MKEFRVAKCLSDDGKRIRKHAILKTGHEKSQYMKMKTVENILK